MAHDRWTVWSMIVVDCVVYDRWTVWSMIVRWTVWPMIVGLYGL